MQSDDIYLVEVLFGKKRSERERAISYSAPLDLRRSVTVLLYQRHWRKTCKRVCGIRTHHDPTSSSMCENYMSLPSVVKAWTNLPTQLQFDDYLFIYSWNEIIDVWKCVLLYRLVEYNSVLYISAMGM